MGRCYVPTHPAFLRPVRGPSPGIFTGQVFRDAHASARTLTCDQSVWGSATGTVSRLSSGVYSLRLGFGCARGVVSGLPYDARRTDAHQYGEGEQSRCEQRGNDEGSRGCGGGESIGG